MTAAFATSLIGREVAAVDTPALLVDLDALDHNLQTMAGFFADKKAKLRPHAKTHKSPTIAHKQLALGAVGITCAKLGEAEVMVAEAGVEDVVMAYPTVGAEKKESVAIAVLLS
jgi:D-serine deaminase-like pyridoxal phosphate-dependent protein